jgi:hypothetical protein
MLRPVLPLSLTPRVEEKVDAGDAAVFFGTFGFNLPTLLLEETTLLVLELLRCLLLKRVCGETLIEGGPGVV